MDSMQMKTMDLKQSSDCVNKDKRDGSTSQKKDTVIDQKQRQADLGTALQNYFNRIPVNSIPGIKNSDVLALKASDTLKDAIHILHEKGVYGAPVLDVSDPSTTCARFSDRYIGFINMPSMLLWCLEEYESLRKNDKETVDENSKASKGIFSILEQNPQIGKTKVSELAMSFLLEPFFPVHLDDTLFHVLLLLSKHPVQLVPIIERSDFQVIGFVTQHAVVHLLLQSDGLEWFDRIADKDLSEFRFENEGHVHYVFGDQSIADTQHVLRTTRTGVVAVVDRRTKKLIGCVRNSDICHLIENEGILANIKNVTTEDFILMGCKTRKKVDSGSEIDNDGGDLVAAGMLILNNKFLPRMDSPVMNKKNDTLKQVIERISEAKSSFSFLVDEMQQVRGIVTLRDIILQFAPPCVDASIGGGGFFDTALEQTGCHMQNGTMVRDH